MSHRFLVVDDNPDNLIALTAQMRDCFPDCSIFEADTGPKALAIAKGHNPDLILLDILMPGMDGFETCRKLKADPDTGNIPVIFLTALRDSREMKLEALKAGADAFLTKPADNAEITTVMLKVQKAATASTNDLFSAEKQLALRIRELEESNKGLMDTVARLRAENESLKRREAELLQALASLGAKEP